MFRSLLRAVAPRALAAALVVATAPFAAPLAAQPAAPAPDAAAKATMTAADKGRVLGRETAPLWVVIISDFQCPYCKRWHDQTDVTLRKQYVEPGKVKVAFLNLPLGFHKQAVPTAEAAMCAAAQGKFWPFHDALFATQPQWSNAPSVAAVSDSIARAIGLDEAKFRTCRTERQTRLLVEEDKRRAESTGAQGTPAFFIGSQFVSGAVPPAEFFRVVDAELAKVAGKP